MDGWTVSVPLTGTDWDPGHRLGTPPHVSVRLALPRALKVTPKGSSEQGGLSQSPGGGGWQTLRSSLSQWLCIWRKSILGF